jgi:hypothetical protein
MRFSWTGLILAPLLVPLILSAATAGFLGGNPVFAFLILLMAGCIVSYGTTLFLFLPCLFVLSLSRQMTGFRVCLLGFVLGAAAYLLLSLVEWKASGPDSGPPVENYFVFLLRWAVGDPTTAIFPVAGLITAGLYWWIGTRRTGRENQAYNHV